MLIKDIIQALERLAPPSYQEDYDNSGLLVGNQNVAFKSALITLDSTEEVIDEAIKDGHNLVIAHHPIVFRGLKRITGKNYIERTIIKAIKNDIAIYAIHTNLDNVSNGVNKKICDLIGLQQTKPLVPKQSLIQKMELFVPKDHKDDLMQKLFDAGAGKIGNYDQCSFQLDGKGTFRANENANPFIGKANEQETVDETRVEFVYPDYLRHQIEATLRKHHPYEEPAYYISTLKNTNKDIGSGMVGELPEEMSNEVFLDHLKASMGLKTIKITKGFRPKVKRVAVCGGSGSFLLRNAINASADIYITADFKYHEFFDAEDKIQIADIGHYESEVFTKALLSDYLRNIFGNIAVNLSKVDTNPITFY